MQYFYVEVDELKRVMRSDDFFCQTLYDFLQPDVKESSFGV